MTKRNPYDGTGKLSDALAALYNTSPKSHNKLAALIQQAKDGLGITSKAKVLPDDIKLAIYRWHFERLNPVSETVETISQYDECKPVEINSQYGFNDLVRIAFYTATPAGRKRQVIALDGFYLNALMLATGVDKKGIPAWVQQAVDGWAAFDPFLPITKQVKYLVIQALTRTITAAIE